MKRNYFIIIVIVSIFCLFLIFFALWWEIQTPVQKEVSLPPPLAPYKSFISGVGVVEPSSGNILIGTSMNRIVQKVLVKVGEKIKKGDVLIRLDNRDLQAELKVQLAAYKSAQAKLQKLQSSPRPEDLSEAEASLKNAKAQYELAKNEYERVLSLPDPRALSEEEKHRRYFNYQQAEAKYKEAQANFDKVKAGTWTPDLEIARYEVQQAKSNFDRIKTEIERTLIRSPIDGTILQVNVHDGEFASLDVANTPMMIIGNIDDLHVKVSINQLDISYFSSSAPAVAYLQGDSRYQFPLDFVRIEPFVVGKQNLTNEISEKVDTRVLKIIYLIKKDHHQVYPGQQMDVFIETQWHKNEK